MKLWIVGEILDTEENQDPDYTRQWSFVGVFYNEEKAVAAAISSYHFVAPADLNGINAEYKIWPGCYYPLAEKEK